MAARFPAPGAPPGALVWQPAPPAPGDAARARLLARGVLLFDGQVVETGAPTPWNLPAPGSGWSDHLHGHGWLDDAAAAADPCLWAHFAGWVRGWIDRHADGTGPGWRADLVARRLTRWIAHAVPLLRGQTPERSRAFFDALGVHAHYLARRWREAEGAARIEALTGLAYADLSLEGRGAAARRTIRALGREAVIVRADGGIDSRNPEELARILALLTWSAETIREAGLTPAAGHLAAIRRAAPVLRALATPAGLPRFHGSRAAGGPTVPRPGGVEPAEGLAMGFLRLGAGDATLVVDAAPPPGGRHAATGHDSALGIEFSVGAQPIIVSCGSGLGFGEPHAVESRRAAAHSTIEIARTSPGQNRSASAPRGRGDILYRADHGDDGVSAIIESTLPGPQAGLTVERRLRLAAGGHGLSGQDTVRATAGRGGRPGHPLGPDEGSVTLRFHLHPAIRTALALGGRAVALTLPDGARWVMRADTGELSLLPSRYYDPDRTRPRATMQIVARTPLVGYSARVVWSFAPVGTGAEPATAMGAAATP